MNKHQKGFTPIVIILLVLTLAGIGGSSYYVWNKKTQDYQAISDKNNESIDLKSQNIDTATWLTYMNKELGIEFKYPSNFNFRQTISPNIANVSFGDYFSVKIGSYQNKSIDEIIKNDFINNVIYRNVTINNLIVDGHKAKRVLYYDPGIGYNDIVFFIESNNPNVFVEFRSDTPKDIVRLDVLTFNQIVSTFKFIDKSFKAKQEISCFSLDQLKNISYLIPSNNNSSSYVKLSDNEWNGENILFSSNFFTAFDNNGDIFIKCGDLNNDLKEDAILIISRYDKDMRNFESWELSYFHESILEVLINDNGSPLVKDAIILDTHLSTGNESVDINKGVIKINNDEYRLTDYGLEKLSNINITELIIPDDWKTYTDQVSGFQYRYPADFFDNKPSVLVEGCNYDISIGCPIKSSRGKLLTINNNPYCLYQSFDAGMSHSYDFYSYVTSKNGQCIKIDLSTTRVSCGVYGSAEDINQIYKECLDREEKYPQILNQVVSSFKFTK
ncbi:MAG: hypothetical protein WC319_05695 [Candidatus Paceibacterota bacterium]|jgi:hypothetical protein